jgi:hypothetical protein
MQNDNPIENISINFYMISEIYGNLFPKRNCLRNILRKTAFCQLGVQITKESVKLIRSEVYHGGDYEECLFLGYYAVWLL